MFRRATAAMICLLAGVPAAQAAERDALPAASSGVETKSPTSMEEPIPGDFWTYEVRDEIGGSTEVRKSIVTQVNPGEIRVDITGGKSGDRLNVYDRSWNLKSTGPWKYQPIDGSGIRAPLKVGAAWSVTADDVNSQNGNIFRRSVNAKVVGQETITTKAGRFDTFKIETVVSRHSTNDPSKKGEIAAQTWYAPAIDHWVKRSFVVRADNHVVNSSTSELVEYGRKK
ncbi:hypothetical protein ABIB90_004939 [Bradyrhizobium sp. JR4.1]|jgi:hypothetical protein|uniref:TapB family protein n=1 Tax=Bradyrhizobium sp. JR4.1 TaxID=3156372 RepID=UPI003391A93C